MFRRRAFSVFGLFCLFIPSISLSFGQSKSSGPPSVERDEILDPIVNKTTAAINLRPDQAAQFRELLRSHSATLTELKSRLRQQPYLPGLLADLDNEQKSIKGELTRLLDEDQKTKLEAFNLQALPQPPGFITIGLPAREGLGPIPVDSPIAAPQTKARVGRLTDDQRILQLLDRASYGPKPGDVESIKKSGIEAYLEEQLHPDKIDDSVLEHRLEVLPTLHLSPGELYDYYPAGNVAMKRATEKNAPPVYGRPRQVSVELMQQKLVRAVESNRQLQEVMTDFWLNHFNVFLDKQPGPYLLTAYERDVIRPNALGKFQDLLLAVAKSPAMLFYLDNWLSQAPGSGRPRQPSAQPAPSKPKPQPAAQVSSGKIERPEPATMDSSTSKAVQANPATPKPATQAQPKPKPSKPAAAKPGINENYARELMELHTLGVDGGYTQKDVQEVARCFTGWTLEHGYQGDASFVFKPWMHDGGAKTVLGVRIAAGGGFSDGLQVLDILSRHPSTARFVSRELCQRFVSDKPSDQLVDRISRVFLRTGGDIAEVLRAIFASPEFNSPNAFRSKIKSPFELAASALRAVDGETDGAPPIEAWITRAGEPLYRYQFPTGYGEDSSRWVNSGVFLNRLNFMVELANNRIKGTHYDPARFGLLLKNSGVDQRADNPGKGIEALIDTLSASIVHTRLSGESRRALMISFGETDVSGTAAMRGATPSNRDSNKEGPHLALTGTGSHPEVTPRAHNEHSPETRVTQVIELLLGTQEFQRR